MGVAVGNPIPLNIGGTATLTANRNGAADNNIVWLSIDPTIATVSTAGPATSVVVTGVREGATTITATDAVTFCSVQIGVQVSAVHQSCVDLVLGATAP